ncbi:MAG: hypothetical protein H6834_18470 [Planctomycetes bacterium]|nr:hypothetical protein [Planctomycetota bacterium]
MNITRWNPKNPADRARARAWGEKRRERREQAARADLPTLVESERALARLQSGTARDQESNS